MFNQLVSRRYGIFGPACEILVDVIGISALLFGLLHGSIYQLRPTFILGLVLGYAVWRSGSLYCGILIHVLNNGLIATLVLDQRRKGLGRPDGTREPDLGRAGEQLSSKTITVGPTLFDVPSVSLHVPNLNGLVKKTSGYYSQSMRAR
jgi:hypothetical protein